MYIYKSNKKLCRAWLFNANFMVVFRRSWLRYTVIHVDPRTPASEFDLVLSIWKMGKRYEQQWKGVKILPCGWHLFQRLLSSDLLHCSGWLVITLWCGQVLHAADDACHQDLLWNQGISKTWLERLGWLWYEVEAKRTAVTLHFSVHLSVSNINLSCLLPWCMVQHLDFTPGW